MMRLLAVFALTTLLAVSPALAGRAILLEASKPPSTTAVSFEGTVVWSIVADPEGGPALAAKVSVPDRELSVYVLLRKNLDASLPASHILEVTFEVGEAHPADGVSGFPGVLVKNDPLKQGTPLVGASARVVANAFLFAMSNSPEDEANNVAGLVDDRWIDLAIIYETGQRALVTMEKDAAAQALFTEVFAAWSRRLGGLSRAPAASGP